MGQTHTAGFGHHLYCRAVVSDTGTGSMVDVWFFGAFGRTNVRQHNGGLRAARHRVFRTWNPPGSEQSSVKPVAPTAPRLRVVPRCRNRMSAALDPATYLQRR